MTKPGIIDAISKSTGVTKQFAEAALEVVFQGLTDALADGNDVKIAKFGKFSIKERKASTTLNPRTGERVVVEKRLSVGFKPSKELRRMVGDKID